MTDDALTCTICHEDMGSLHQIVKPRRCNHTFHAICLNIWLARHRSCPLCRRRISITSQSSWRTLFLTALVISQEATLERAAFTYAFLSQLLKTYDTPAKWLRSKDAIIAASEHFELGQIRLPFLDLTSRSTAKREKQTWKKRFEHMSGECVRTSERIKSARRVLLTYESDALRTSETAHTTAQ